MTETIHRLLIFAILLATTSCQLINLFETTRRTSYQKLIYKNKKETYLYREWNNKVTIQSVLMTPEIKFNARTQLDKIYANTSTSERTILHNNPRQTTFFISIFCPKISCMDLHNKDIWSVSLKHNDILYHGSILKSPFSLEKTKFLFSFTTHFSRYYFIKFDIPVNSFIKEKGVLMFYSPFGSLKINY